MIQTPHILPNAPDSHPHKAQSIVETLTQYAPASGTELVGEGLAQNAPTLAIVGGSLLLLLIAVRRLKRKAAATRAAALHTGEGFAASVDIPPYVDTDSLAAAAASIDPEEAIERLTAVWTKARQKEAANPLYSPNSSERMARDAVDIERLFCSGQLAKHLARISPDQFARLANTAETLRATVHCQLIREAKALAIHGHSDEMKAEPRKGPAWAAFRRKIADLDKRLQQVNRENRMVVTADAYLGQVLSTAA